MSQSYVAFCNVWYNNILLIATIGYLKPLMQVELQRTDKSQAN